MASLFGENLKRLRRAAGLTQDGLAERAWPGKSLSSGRVAISKYERGDMVPRPQAQEALALALGCRVGDFWGEYTAAQADPVEPPPGHSDFDPVRAEEFDAWARDQVMELARRTMAQLQVVVGERDQAREEADELRLEVERLRTVVARLSGEKNELRMRLGEFEGNVGQPRATDSAQPPTIQEPGENEGSKKSY